MMTPPPEEIRNHLRALLGHSLFSTAAHPREFLRWIVEQALQGKQHEIAGPNILAALRESLGQQVSETAVRTAARELRRKLQLYYQSSEGMQSAIRIQLPPSGSYVPSFTSQTPAAPSPPPQGALDTSTNDLLELSLLNLYSRAGLAVHRDEWVEALRITEPVAQPVRGAEAHSPAVVRYLILSRVLRLGAFARTGEHGKAALETLRLLDHHDIVALRTSNGQLFGLACSLAILVFENVGDHNSAANFRQLLLTTPEAPDEQRITFTRTAIATARRLNSLELYQAAIRLLNDALLHLPELPSTPITRAEIIYLLQWNHKDLDQHSESLAFHQRMLIEFHTQSATRDFSWLAWSETEAARSLRALKRYDEADEIASRALASLSAGDAPSKREATAWAVVELSKSAYAQGHFAESATICSQAIGTLPAFNHDGALDHPYVWSYAQRAQSLRRMSAFDGAIATCDEIFRLFSGNSNPDVQSEVAWTMLEKAVCLRRAKRLGASLAAAQEMVKHFAGSQEPRIVKERIWAIHAEGDALLCEAKLLLHAGMQEDAHRKLTDAIRIFSQAAGLDPKAPWHLGCIAYAHFLRGDLAAAESSLRNALTLKSTDWQGGDHDEWSEVSMFPLPQDEQFKQLREAWTATFKSSTAKPRARAARAKSRP